MAMVSAVLSLVLSASIRPGSHLPAVATQKRAAPALVAVLALAALVALTACGGGGGGEEEPAATTPAGQTPTEAPAVERPTPTPEGRTPTAAASAAARINWCDLVTPEEADEALGEFVTGILDLANRYCEFETDSEVFLRIEPGSPEDLESGAEIEGVRGETVSGVGEEAAWFDGEPAVLSVRQGDVYLRIVLNMPDATRAERLEIAKGLAATAAERLP
ncbi:MAG: hypothetical protein HYY03_03345 [Chloroflexi bacterium]|nr:hypothetical protein [Chloroflexota bacterium]